MKFKLKEDGINVIENFIDDHEIKKITTEIDSISFKLSEKHGVRNAEKKFKSIEHLINSEPLTTTIYNYLGTNAQLVRVILFDKTPDKNWLVSWHQDKTIAVKQKQDIPGWEPWSIKEGIYHVQPNVELLNHMLTFRLHLDDTDENNGCLKIVPKSHKRGFIDQNQVAKVIAQHGEHLCKAKAGDLLIMRPLLLHASSKAITPEHRRIIHIEYCNYKLPKGLNWIE